MHLLFRGEEQPGANGPRSRSQTRSAGRWPPADFCATARLRRSIRVLNRRADGIEHFGPRGVERLVEERPGGLLVPTAAELLGDPRCNPLRNDCEN